MNDLFNDYGVPQKTIMQMIEEFAYGFLIRGLPCPTKIVLPKQAIDAYNAELSVKSNPPSAEAGSVIKTYTSAGQIEIVEG